MRRRFLTGLLIAASLKAAIPSCPAGVPLGGVDISVTRDDPSSPILLNKINQLQEGDEIHYAPALRPGEKRRGEVTVVIVAASPGISHEESLTVLDTKSADKPANWKVPFRSRLAVYVYGPSGLSMRKLKGFLSKDQELIAQLADYAEKTAQTESVMQALSAYESSGHSENLSAALQGFAGQYSVSNKIDWTAPVDQRTLAALRTLNPALSTYDPISPSGLQRVSQTAGLATTVAAMFFGSTVGLAAGSTAMAFNLKTLMFPDTDFRSAYAQPANAAVDLCAGREAAQSRKRLAYLWALRVPNAPAPVLAVDGPEHMFSGLKWAVKMRVSDPEWKLVSRAHGWALRAEDGKRFPIPVTTVTDPRGVELNLTSTGVPPGKYVLTARWDWDAFDVSGHLYVDEAGRFDHVSLAPESQNVLRQRSGKQLITLTGADFQFLQKTTIVKKDDRYATPAPVLFTLPVGQRRGSQDRVEMQVDTTNLDSGEYTLALFQPDGKPQSTAVKVLQDPPRLNGLPLTVNQGESEQVLSIEGEGLDRILSFTAEGLDFTLETPESGGRKRAVRVRHLKSLTAGSTETLNMTVRGYGAPVALTNGLRVGGPRPRIEEAKASLPSDLQIALLPRELPAGVSASLLVRTRAAGPEPALRLNCRNMNGPVADVTPGTEQGGIRLQPMTAGTFFVSFDPGKWPDGCVLQAVLSNREAGPSEPFKVGKVVRLPSVDSFRLTDETAGENIYVGMLTGSDLELIEKTGWDAEKSYPVEGLPTPIAGSGNKQTLKLQLPWPSPAPHSPLYIWFRGEKDGRATKIRY